MTTETFPRIDSNPELRKRLLQYCRLKSGEVWEDPEGRHRVGVLDATKKENLERLVDGCNVDLMVNDPPYNFSVGGKNTSALSAQSIDRYIAFSKAWVMNAIDVLAPSAHFYIWLGADQKNGFQPLPDFMLMMREFTTLKSRSFITLRNQRGYGTQKNWMAVRQELLYYVKEDPIFRVCYTDIPKVLKGYYKTVQGTRTENMQRSLSDTIRPGNVWLDIQQVFYRMEENVPGAFAQKPLRAIERLLNSAPEAQVVGDLFCHSGTSLIAAERLQKSCYTSDIDPIFAELTIRRLEHYRSTGRTGWQWRSPFPELNT
ncbi:MAG: site-specific DNA-methyltransferase [Spirochaetia bacterium]